MTLRGLPQEERRVAIRFRGAPQDCCSCLNLAFTGEGDPFCRLPDKPNAKCSGEGELIFWKVKEKSGS